MFSLGLDRDSSIGSCFEASWGGSGVPSAIRLSVSLANAFDRQSVRNSREPSNSGSKPTSR